MEMLKFSSPPKNGFCFFCGDIKIIHEYIPLLSHASLGIVILNKTLSAFFLPNEHNYPKLFSAFNMDKVRKYVGENNVIEILKLINERIAFELSFDLSVRSFISYGIEKFVYLKVDIEYLEQLYPENYYTLIHDTFSQEQITEWLTHKCNFAEYAPMLEKTINFFNEKGCSYLLNVKTLGRIPVLMPKNLFQLYSELYQNPLDILNDLDAYSKNYFRGAFKYFILSFLVYKGKMVVDDAVEKINKYF